MSDGRVFLKVKIKSLAEEARIIKREERNRKVPRYWGHDTMNVTRSITGFRHPDNQQMRDLSAKRRSRDWYPRSAAELHELHLHRINVVRKEARLTGIAYGFIRGRALAAVDSSAGLTASDWERVGAMVKKYGAYGAHQRLQAWREAQGLQQAA